jgi:protein TonB
MSPIGSKSKNLSPSGFPGGSGFSCTILDPKKVLAITISIAFHAFLLLNLSKILLFSKPIDRSLIEVNIIQIPQHKTKAPPPPAPPSINLKKEITKLTRITPIPIKPAQNITLMLKPAPEVPDVESIKSISKKIPLSAKFYKPIAIKTPSINTLTKRTSGPTKSITTQAKSESQGNYNMLENYIASIREKIKEHKIYPEQAQDEGLQGKVFIEFTVNKKGNVEKVKIVKSSGYSILDRAAIYSIMSSSPFNPIPKNINKKLITLKLWIKFKLE